MGKVDALDERDFVELPAEHVGDFLVPTAVRAAPVLPPDLVAGLKRLKLARIRPSAPSD